MLHFINDMPVHVIGIHAVGDITKDEVERELIPRLNELVKKQRQINYLLILETDIRNFTLGAIIEKLKAGLKHYTRWNKIAVVTDQKGVVVFSNIVEIFIPGESRGFPLDKLDEAIMWVCEKKKQY